MYFVECRVVDTRQSRLCRVSRGGTRQRSEKQSLPSVPGWHSAKKAPLPSAADLALGKPYFKNKKNLCRVPHRGHSAKNTNLAKPTASPSSLSHSRSLSRSRRRPRSPPTPRPRPPSPPATRAPRPSTPSTPSRPPRPRKPAVAPSTPSRPFAVVHRPRRATRYKFIFRF